MSQQSARKHDDEWSDHVTNEHNQKTAEPLYRGVGGGDLPLQPDQQEVVAQDLGKNEREHGLGTRDITTATVGEHHSVLEGQVNHSHVNNTDGMTAAQANSHGTHSVTDRQGMCDDKDAHQADTGDEIMRDATEQVESLTSGSPASNERKRKHEASEEGITAADNKKHASISGQPPTSDGQTGEDKAHDATVESHTDSETHASHRDVKHAEEAYESDDSDRDDVTWEEWAGLGKKALIKKIRKVDSDLKDTETEIRKQEIELNLTRAQADEADKSNTDAAHIQAKPPVSKLGTAAAIQTQNKTTIEQVKTSRNICVCMYIYVYVCMYVCVCMHIYVRVCVCIFTCVCMYVYLRVYACMHIYVCVCMHESRSSIAVFRHCSNTDSEQDTHLSVETSLCSVLAHAK
jgi:hypothetical protein